MAGHPSRLQGVRLAALAGAVHLAFDALASRLELVTPPYLLLDHAAEFFREILELDRTAVLVTVAVGAAVVNGVIAALLATALEPSPRRRGTLGWALFGLWLFSGGLMILVYLYLPWGVVLGSLAAGLPRSFAVAWVLDRAMPAPAPSTRPSPGG
jgi:hypothetical protein